MTIAVPSLNDLDQFRSVNRHFSDESELWTRLYKRPDVYARGFQIRQRLAMDFASSIVDPDGRQALDLGCGGGLAAIELARRGFHVRAVDISERMIESARANVAAAKHTLRGRVSFLAANLVDAGLDAGCFDLIVGLGVFEYFPDPQALVREIRRILRSGGFLIITAPNPQRLSFRAARRWSRFSNRFWRLQRLAGRLRTADVGRTDHPAETVTFRRNNVSPDDFDRLWTEHGFERIGYAGNGLGYGCDQLVRLPLIGGRVASFLSTRLALASKDRRRILANLSSGYTGFYKKCD